METNRIPSHFLIKTNPIPEPGAVVKTRQARFTVLAPRLIRIEWSPTGNFEDRASQAFWFRNHPIPAYQLRKTETRIVIETEELKLTYLFEEKFSDQSLWIDLKGTDVSWHFGDQDPNNLGGTARTLDEVDGPTSIGVGLVSRSGWSVVDDSNSLVFNENSWLEPRYAPEGQLDLYFFGYGHDYQGCLREFNLISGNVPMIPRFVLGNWWSRYWAYSQDDILNLMSDFEKHEVPLSVCIIDMDWHITKTGNESSGWTGYTWNRELFPDPEGLLKSLHAKGLMVALNLHPADGVHRHEEMYTEMSEAVGKDPEKGDPVEFDITNPQFVNAYFNVLHHPQEKRGIDFWWMDWQQGFKTRLSGLDPLWWLNHLHFLDLGRDGKRRSFIFSRWGGYGNHRYPIGFSGDSVITWASLAFQPFFTATASNVNYGWWSHDIGGHMGGIEDSELYARWVQLGAFLPILRLHSTNNSFLERRPWARDSESFDVARSAMQLRHALIPYLYSMAWRYHKESIPPLLPMYYSYPEQDDAYACPNQYLFGSELVVAPYTQPSDRDTRLSRSVVWLPDGDWYDYFTGTYYEGGWRSVYGSLREIPVFAKAGAIVPTGPMVGKGGVGIPDHLIIHAFAGADGSFNLYEDEGNTNFYLDGAYAVTPMHQTWDNTSSYFAFGPAQGDTRLLPATRTVNFNFRGYEKPQTVLVKVNGETISPSVEYDETTLTIKIGQVTITPSDKVEVSLSKPTGLASRLDSRAAQVLKMLKYFRMESNAKESLARALPVLLDKPEGLGRFFPSMGDSQISALFEILCEAGVDISTSTGKELLTIWNRKKDEKIIYLSSIQRVHHWWRYRDRVPTESGIAPKFKAYRPEDDFGEGNPWLVQINYYGVYLHKIGSADS